MEFSQDFTLPLSVAALEDDVDLSQAEVACLLVPRRCMRRVVGSACRFADIALESSPRHVHDLVFYVFLLRALRQQGLVKEYVARAFVDERNPHVVALFLVLAPGKRVDAFARALEAEVAHNAAVVLDEEPAAQAGDGPGDGPARGGTRGRKRSRFTGGYKEAAIAALRRALTLVKRPSVPVDRIACDAPFNHSVIAWGCLITDATEMRNAIADVVRSRLLELGRTARVVSQPAAAVAAANRVLGDMVMDEDEGMMTEEEEEQPAAAAAAPPSAAEEMFAFDDGEQQSINVSLQGLLSLQHAVTRRFLDPAAVGDSPALLAGRRGVYELLKPLVDLPHLDERFLASSEVYDQFNLFADRQRSRRDALEANPRGDLPMLSAFFAANPELRDADRRASARLSFDVMTRKDGKLPKSWLETMSFFIDTLDKNGGCLPAGTGQPVEAYRNLSYSANYALYLLKQFEQMGTFYFHVEQFVTMLVLDGVVHRPRSDDDDDDQTNVGMCANLMNYGPPGVGKSNASIFFLSAYKFTYVTNTYSSQRSIYSNLLSSDFLNSKASYHDEAPNWIPETSAKSAPQVGDLIAHMKERLSSGRMNGERLVRDDLKNVHKTVMFNVDVQNAPMIMNTNARERDGHPPLLERFIPRYFTFCARAQPHALQTGAGSLAPDVKRSIRREFQLMNVLMLIAGKLQTDGIISFPCTLVFNSFYDRFLAELRLNPYLDTEPPTSKDRRSSIIELLYSFYVLRSAIHRLFLAPGGRHAGKPFDVEHMLDLQEEMCTGDVSAAVLAIGAYSHGFRSPTEYRCADLLAGVLMGKLTREFRARAATEADPLAKTYFSSPPRRFDAFSPDGDKALHLATQDDPVAESKFYGGGQPSLAGGRMNTRYVFVDSKPWSYGAPSVVEMCGKMAHDLLEGQAGNTNKIMPEHAQKRLHLLATTGARCGPDKGFTPLVFVSDSKDRCFKVFVLVSWLTEATVTHEFSMHAMLKRAAFACSYTAPGTYLTLEPFQLARNPGLAQADSGTVPSMLEYFVVPLHEQGCAERDEETERALPRAFVPSRHAGAMCSCFRSLQAPARVADQDVHVDPTVSALCKFRAHTPRARYPKNWCAGPGLYPRDCLREALAGQAKERGTARDEAEVAAEMGILEELLNEARIDE